jgi:hypothetical protein
MIAARERSSQSLFRQTDDRDILDGGWRAQEILNLTG